MARRFFLVLAAAAFAPFVAGSAVSGSAATQKISVSLSGDCADKVMDEAEEDADCSVKVTVTPASPTRTFTFQEVAPGEKKWRSLKKVRAASGKASFTINELDGDEMYREGKFSFRVTAPSVGKKQKAYTSPTLKVEFVPVSDDFSDDYEDDDEETSTGGSNSKTPKPEAKPAPKPEAKPAPTPDSKPATQTPTHGGSYGGGATTTTVASGTNGGTPTNTSAPGNENLNWFAGVAPTTENLGAFCDSNDPTMYVGATICSSTGIGGRKSLSQFKALIAPIPNTAYAYKRNGFCTQAFGASGVTDREIIAAKCAEVDAGR